MNKLILFGTYTLNMGQSLTVLGCLRSGTVITDAKIKLCGIMIYLLCGKNSGHVHPITNCKTSNHILLQDYSSHVHGSVFEDILYTSTENYG